MNLSTKELLESLLVNIPKTTKGQETLNRICQAAEEAFCNKGYHNTSVNEITVVAGISTGTFYLYFASKLTLYEYVLSQYGYRIRKHISMRVAHCTSRREVEREGLRAWLEFILGHKYVFNITWESLFIDRRLFDRYYAEFSAAYVRQLNKAKLVGEIADIDSEILSFALMGITNFIGMHWVLFREEQDIEYLITETMKIIDAIFPAET